MNLELRIPPEALRERIAELGRDLTTVYAGTQPVLITVLRGGVVFLADLVRQIGLPVEVDLIAISPYGASGTARFVKDLDEDIAGRHVLIVEDIIDTGLTLAYLIRTLAARRPASLRVCTLLDRSVRRIAEVPLDWVGFEVGDEYLVGYGLDLDGRLRGLDGVFTLADPQVRSDGLETVAARLLEQHRVSSDRSVP